MEIKGNEDILNYLKSITKRNVFHHAYIFAGSHSVPTEGMATKFAQMLYCEGGAQGGMFGETNHPCGTCVHCHQVSTALHPDLKILESEEGKHAISIKQIRDLQNHLMQSPAAAPYTIGIIKNAHEMSTAAGNALLKTLEEPSSTSLLILLTHAPDDLLSTIRSRSQVIEFSDHESVLPDNYDPEELHVFQTLFTASKGQVLELLDDQFSSKKKHKNEKDFWYNRFSMWKTLLREMIMVKLGTESTTINVDTNLTISQLQEGIDSLTDLQKKLSQNINTRLHVEAYFVNLLR